MVRMASAALCMVIGVVFVILLMLVVLIRIAFKH